MKHRVGRAIARGIGASALAAVLASGALAPAAQPGRAATNPSNTLTIGWAIETKTLDPANSAANPDIWVMVSIFDPLLRLGSDGKTIIPGLATSWSISKDATTYSFHLRKGATYSDGTPVTSGDVKFSLARAVKPTNSWAYLISIIKEVDTPDPNTVVIHLKHAWAPFLADMTFFTTGVYPQAYFQKVGAAAFSMHPIGSGPYMLDSWVKGQYLRLKKNPRYWDSAKYPMPYVEYDLIPSDNTRLLKLEAGELDVDNNISFAQTTALKGSSTASVTLDKSTLTIYLALNTKFKPLNDVNVRQAISHAINRAALSKAVTAGYGTPANSFMPAGSLYYDPTIPVPAYDLAAAKRYLAQSSAPHGFTLSYESQAGVAYSGQIAQIVQQELAPLGIKVQITPTDPTTLYSRQQAGKTPLIDTIWTNDIPDPDELASFAMDYTSGAYAFYSWYNNPRSNALVHAGEATNDAAKRKSIYAQLQQLWATDQPFLALYYVPFVNGVSSKVHGFSENPLGYFNLEGVTKS